MICVVCVCVCVCLAIFNRSNQKHLSTSIHTHILYYTRPTYMPTRRTYDLRITNTFTGETTECSAPDLLGCRDAINKHFGCNMITKHGVVNLMVRGKEGSPDRFAGIRITSMQPDT
jgi:hypothetical protein